MPSLFPEPSQLRTPPTRTNQQSWLIAHCDGGARGNPGPAGYGAVLQTESGELLAELSEFLGIRTNNYAEYSGLLGVLAWALDHGHRRLRVVSDSELMVKQIQGRYKVNSPDLKPLWTEAHSRIAQLDEFQITHALRHKNKDADRLANAAMDRGMGRASAGPTDPKAEPKHESRATPYPKDPAAAPPIAPPMLRGFTRGGVVHLLGDARLPDGIFVKIVPE
jgi:probable phosphoglycerate mutase